MKLNKKLVIPAVAILGLGLLVAATGFVVNSFVIKADVIEPFSVEYYIIGDGGDYDGSYCSEVAEGDWMVMPDGQELDLDGLYPGEGRKFCVRINNAGEGDIPYTIFSDVLTGYGNHEDCVSAFGEITKTGTAGEGITIDGEVIEIAPDSPPVEDCRIEISVARG